MSRRKYPRKCLKYGHDHSGSGKSGGIWTAHTEQCKNYFWGLFDERCPHIQTFMEAIEEAGGLREPPFPPPPLPLREVHVYHHYSAKDTK